MSLSLIAVFIPLLFMGGIVGRLFREFAVTLSVAVAISLVVSLTTTPMMCARLLHSEKGRRHGRAYSLDASVPSRASSGATTGAWAGCCGTGSVTLAILLVTIGLNWYLFIDRPEGLLPAAGQRDDVRRHPGVAEHVVPGDAADPGRRRRHHRRRSGASNRSSRSPAAADRRNSARMFIALKPLAERKVTADQVIARLRPKFAHDPRASLFMQAAQDIRVGGRGCERAVSVHAAGRRTSTT